MTTITYELRDKKIFLRVNYNFDGLSTIPCLFLARNLFVLGENWHYFIVIVGLF